MGDVEDEFNLILSTKMLSIAVLYSDVRYQFC
jgi:hypothetical protein